MAYEYELIAVAEENVFYESFTFLAFYDCC